MLRWRMLVVPLLPLTFLSWIPAHAAAGDDGDVGSDQNVDIAIPQRAPADTRPSSAGVQPATATMTVFAAAAVRTFIDDFKYDPLVLEGRAADVCAGRLLTGSGWTFNEIVSRFGGSAGTMYSCRERWDQANDPECNGHISNPVTEPNFTTTCWSNHAQGRAIDVMVGALSGGGYNRTRGLAIVNWLLAWDAQRNVNSNARRLGIQQILFDDRCWNADGDRGISSWSAMRECGIGHHDHVHLDLTINGANGNVSYWGAAPEVHAKLDTQVFWEQQSAWRQAVSWFNGVSYNEDGLAVPAQYDQIAVGDLDRDGIQDETFLWDHETGNWALQNWNGGDSLTARIGHWSNIYDVIRMGDFDADGYVNDMFLWDKNTGNYRIVSWSGYSTYLRTTGVLSASWDEVYAADLDANGFDNEMLVFDRQTGKYAVYSWQGYQRTLRTVDYLPLGGDRLIVGDWNAGGDLDETLLWDVSSGQWVEYSWSAFRPRYQRQGRWSSAIDIASPGDYDSDGRVDDLFLYDTGTGQWAIYSFHRYVPTQITQSTWGRGYDVITVGSFMD